MDIDVLAIAAVAITVVLFVLLSYLGRKKNVDFGILTILALVFGIVIGIIFKGHVELTAVFGRIYTNLISALVIPLLFVSIISSISSLDNISKLKTIGLKSIFWLVANTFTASLLTLIIAGSLKVGQSINFTLPTDYEPKEVPSFLDTIVGLFPKNVVSHAANGEIVPFIVFTIMAGVALVYLQEREKEAAVPFKNFIDSANKLMFVVVEFVVDLTPFCSAFSDRKCGKYIWCERTDSASGSSCTVIRTLCDPDVPDRRSTDPVCRRIKSDPVFPRILAGTGGGIYVPVQRGNHSCQRKTAGIQAGSQ